MLNKLTIKIKIAVKKTNVNCCNYNTYSYFIIYFKQIIIYNQLAK